MPNPLAVAYDFVETDVKANGERNNMRSSRTMALHLCVSLTIIFLLSLCLISQPAMAQEMNPPTWVRAEAQPMSPEEAREILANRQIPATCDIVALAAQQGYPLGPPDIQALARALKNNVDLIYQFVHDTIEYEPKYGDTKY